MAAARTNRFLEIAAKTKKYTHKNRYNINNKNKTQQNDDEFYFICFIFNDERFLSENVRGEKKKDTEPETTAAYEQSERSARKAVCT